MKASVGLVAIMAGLAMANPLAGSAETARASVVDELKYFRVGLVKCLETNPPADVIVPEWAASTASKYNTRDGIVQAIEECQAMEE